MFWKINSIVILFDSMDERGCHVALINGGIVKKYVVVLGKKIFLFSLQLVFL